MPKSKRDKSVSLTKTPKRGNMLNKQVLAKAVYDSVRSYNFVYVFSVVNMRNSKLKDIRSEWSDSRIFLGKVSAMKFGLGQTPQTENGPNLHQVTKMLCLQSGLLFSNRPVHHVFEWFKKYNEWDYARAGTVASKSVTLQAGPMPQFAFSMETHLRGLGMPTRLDHSIVELTSDFVVCTKGQILRPDQTKILKLLGMKLARFRVDIKCGWTKKTGVVSYPEETVSEDEENQEDNHDEEMDEGEQKA